MGLKKEQVQIGRYLYIKEEKYNHNEHYDYAEDIDGVLYTCHYGHDGDKDWYITCFEEVGSDRLTQSIDEKYYYKRVGQAPYALDHVDGLDKFVGKILSKETIENKTRYGFIDFDEWKFYILHEE